MNFSTSQLRGDAISLEKRNLYCSLAVAESDWIAVNKWGWANGYRICEQTAHLLNSSWLCDIPFQVYLVVGSDHAFRHGLYASSEHVICIHRNQDGEELKKVAAKSVRDNFILVDGEPVDISSTLVRKLLKAKDWKKLADILPQHVLEYLKTH